MSFAKKDNGLFDFVVKAAKAKIIGEPYTTVFKIETRVII